MPRDKEYTPIWLNLKGLTYTIEVYDTKTIGDITITLN